MVHSSLQSEIDTVLLSKKNRRGFTNRLGLYTIASLNQKNKKEFWQIQVLESESKTLSNELGNAIEKAGILEILVPKSALNKSTLIAEPTMNDPLLVKETVMSANVSTQTSPTKNIHISTQTVQINPRESLHDRFINAKDMKESEGVYKNQKRKVQELPSNYNAIHGNGHAPQNAQNTQNGNAGFVSAAEKLAQENSKKGNPSVRKIPNKKSKFISPLLARNKEEEEEKERETPKVMDERLKNIDPQMAETICNEIMEQSSPILWEDIAGLSHAKKSIQEIVVWPMLRPDLFFGIRGPPKGLLLFGPPGTGKTLIGKCIASQCKATFFSISSSSLTSKWVGEGEKMVRALFAVARAYQPSVIFVDEIDSLLSQRTDGEQEATRRIKTEFLVQFDGCGTNANDRILMIGATNRPHEIDEAARRRFRKKLYIPLPQDEARKHIILNLLGKQKHDLEHEDIDEIVIRTRGYSGSDMDGLVREAALGPIRDIADISIVNVEDVRSIAKKDFMTALKQVRASVSEKDLDLYLKFDAEFGSLA